MFSLILKILIPVLLVVPVSTNVMGDRIRLLLISSNDETIGVSPLWKHGDPNEYHEYGLMMSHVNWAQFGDEVQRREGRRIRQAEQTVAQNYSRAGAEVIFASPSAIREWGNRNGNQNSDETWDFLLIRYAKENNVDVVGGLGLLKVAPHDFALYSWILNLRRVTRSYHRFGRTDSIPHLRDSYEIDVPDKFQQLFQVPGNRSAWAFPASAPTNSLRRTECVQESVVPFLGVWFEEACLNESDSVAYIQAIAADSPAEQAGLQLGDIIVSIDNANAMEVLEFGLDSFFQSEDLITLRVLRGDHDRDYDVQLADTSSYFAAKSGNQVRNWIAMAKGLGSEDIGQNTRDENPRIVVVYFWSLYSGEQSLVHLPILQLLWERYRSDGLLWIGVAIDPQLENKKWEQFRDANRLGGLQVRSEFVPDSFFPLENVPASYLFSGDGEFLRCVEPEQLTAAIIQEFASRK